MSWIDWWLRVCLVCVFSAASGFATELPRVDLHKWGYTTGEQPASSGFVPTSVFHLVSVGMNGDIIVGFLTRDRKGLTTRELPAFSLHVLRFREDGMLLSQTAIPTENRNENAVFSGIDGRILVRAGSKLDLFSDKFELLAKKDLASTPGSAFYKWKIFPLPERAAFLLYEFQRDNTSTELVDWHDLQSVRRCSLHQHNQLLSVSRNNVLWLHPTPGNAPLLRSIEISKICGPSQLSYSWKDRSTHAELITDQSIIVAGGAGSSTVDYVKSGKIQWTDSFNKKSDVISNHVEVSSAGTTVALEVNTLTGGSTLLDIPRKLKQIRMIVYKANSGRRALNLSVKGSAPKEFDFALSPKGDVLAIVSDGYLQTVHVVSNSGSE